VTTTYTYAGVRSKISSAFTSITSATGITSPIYKGVLRYVIGTLAAQTISGTVKLVMRVSESNTGANANLSIAVKIIKPDGSDRAVLLAYTSSDSASAPYEMTTTLSVKYAYDTAEAYPISLTAQSPTAGDYLVVEIGFRSATTTTRNIVHRIGDNSADDCPETVGDVNDYCPWVEFSQTLSWQSQTYNEGITLSSTPACSHSPQADLLGGINLASTPALSRAAIVDMLGGVTMLSAPSASMMGGMDLFNNIAFLSDPAVVMGYGLDIFPSLILASNPALAVYPVIIDPTFGYTTIGTVDSSNLNGRWWGYRFTGVAGTGVSITAHLHTASTKKYKFAVYKVADNLLLINGTTEEGTGDGTTGWKTLNFTVAPTLEAVDYYLVAWSDGDTYLDYDTGTTDYCVTEALTYGAWDTDITGCSTSNKKFSIYCTYEAAGGGTYNEGITLSSTPACSHSPKVDFSPSLAAFASTPALLRSAQADLLGSINLASTPALSRAAIVDMLGGVTMLSAPSASMMGGMDLFNNIAFLSDPAVSMAHVLDIFPSVVLASNPALAASAIADFYNSLTLASTPAAVMAAIADLFASLALASDPAFAVVGGSDFYESLALSSSPALSNAVFKEAFGELSLASSPALAAAVLADLLASIAAASSPALLAAAGFDINEAITFLGNALFTAASALMSGPVTSIGSKRAAAGLSNRAPAGLGRAAGAGLRRDA